MSDDEKEVPEGLKKVAKLLDASLENSAHTGVPFFSGTIAQCPQIRPASLPEDFPNPPEWKEEHYAQVKPLLTQAPYGKGMETVIDKEVRNALEIPKDKLAISSQAVWEGLLTKAVHQAAEKLAPSLSPHEVSAELYKLVVYEEGGHFKPHRDTQRSETHFGTLVILLPGKATGGELILRHGALEETFTIPTGKKRCTFVAYFADVEHEVRPVIKGRRISLLYHLHRSKLAAKVTAPAPSSSSSSSSSASLPPIVGLLKAFSEELQEDAAGPPRKKARREEKDGDGDDGDEEKEKGKGKAKEEGPDPTKIAFAGYVCEHTYAGEVNGEKLKGKDAAFFKLFAPHFPGTRVAHIDIRAHGPAGGDSGSWIKSPRDLDEVVVEVDEVDTKVPLESKSDRFGGWGQHAFSKTNHVARPLFCDTFKGSDYDIEADQQRTVQFLNHDLDMYETAIRVKASERSVRGSGNEGSSGAFLYKRVAILVPLLQDAESYLVPFSAEHARRSHPDYLP